MNDTNLIALPRVIEIAGIKRGAIYKRLKTGRFPRPLAINSRCNRWRESDVRAWVAGLAERSYA